MGNVISDLALGATSGVFSGLGSLAKDIRVAITGIDPEKQAAIEEKLLDLEAAGDAAQMKVNEIEAANPSLFVSGWRPFVGWVCGTSMAYNYVVTPFMQTWLDIAHTNVKIPVLDMSVMLPVLMGMLGLGGLRTYEHLKGVARKN